MKKKYVHKGQKISDRVELGKYFVRFLEGMRTMDILVLQEKLRVLNKNLINTQHPQYKKHFLVFCQTSEALTVFPHKRPSLE